MSQGSRDGNQRHSIVEVDPVTEKERLAHEDERERVWEWVGARCVESMPEWDRQEWVREQRAQERLENPCADVAHAERNESWAGPAPGRHLSIWNVQTVTYELPHISKPSLRPPQDRAARMFTIHRTQDLQKGERHTYNIAVHSATCKQFTHGASHWYCNGESPERAWAALSTHAGSTTEMSPAKGHDFNADDSTLWEQAPSLDANFKLKCRPRDPALEALLQSRQVQAKNAPGGQFPDISSIRRIGQNGVKGIQSNSVELDIDGDELPGLIGVDDDNNWTLKLRADEVIVKAKFIIPTYLLSLCLTGLKEKARADTGLNRASWEGKIVS
ncbi:hypothetical protein DFH08DRAFT_823977 [Mycena albidolilacea]|uniref:Uncharacterized protein n=1 Tax=Mycena albidolilacea TaxID=1033008 RepID=A0AAD7EBG7_9AGAR|nr:hypothetical protein DFH08DRAFT_823977 [Mycena albidolilacea]